MILIPPCLTLHKILTDLGLILDVWTIMILISPCLTLRKILTDLGLILGSIFSPKYRFMLVLIISLSWER